MCERAHSPRRWVLSAPLLLARQQIPCATLRPVRLLRSGCIHMWRPGYGALIGHVCGTVCSAGASAGKTLLIVLTYPYPCATPWEVDAVTVHQPGWLELSRGLPAFSVGGCPGTRPGSLLHSVFGSEASMSLTAACLLRGESPCLSGEFFFACGCKGGLAVIRPGREIQQTLHARLHCAFGTPFADRVPVSTCILCVYVCAFRVTTDQVLTHEVLCPAAAVVPQRGLRPLTLLGLTSVVKGYSCFLLAMLLLCPCKDCPVRPCSKEELSLAAHTRMGPPTVPSVVLFAPQANQQANCLVEHLPYSSILLCDSICEVDAVTAHQPGRLSRGCWHVSVGCQETGPGSLLHSVPWAEA